MHSLRGTLRSSGTLAALGIALAGAVTASCEQEPARTALSYTEGAKSAYDQAMALFKAHQWIEAQLAMRDVKRKYSYSRYARLAELRIADADYEQEKFSDAIREYKEFVHAHRADEEDVAYARARIGEAMYAEIPDSFFMAASEERDQASVVDAYKDLKAFLADYAHAKESPHVRDLLGRVTARLIRHELYVARFYLTRANYEAAVERIEYALRNYPEAVTETGIRSAEEAELHAEALLLLGEIYLKLHKWPEAREAFEAIVRRLGGTPVAIQAQSYLTAMSNRGV